MSDTDRDPDFANNEIREGVKRINRELDRIGEIQVIVEGDGGTVIKPVYDLFRQRFTTSAPEDAAVRTASPGDANAFCPYFWFGGEWPLG